MGLAENEEPVRHLINVNSYSSEACESTEDSKPHSAVISPLRLCTVNRFSLV